MNTTSRTRRWLGLAALASLTLLAACERPPMETVQHGYRGTGMVQVYNPRALVELDKANVVPEAQPPADASGPKAGAVYQNVQVLGDLSDVAAGQTRSLYFRVLID